jgi:hypothetical protein
VPLLDDIGDGVRDELFGSLTRGEDWFLFEAGDTVQLGTDDFAN